MSWDCGGSTTKEAVVLGQDLWECEAENNFHLNDLHLLDKTKNENCFYIKKLKFVNKDVHFLKKLNLYN